MFLNAFGALAVVSTLPFALTSPNPATNIFPRTPVSGIDLSDLAPQLSPNAKIYLPGSTEFTSHTVRWSNLSPPTPNVVIAPGTEADVASIVKFANEKDIPFLAYNGHHGTLTTLGKMEYGIQIYLPELNTISIAEDGKSVTVGGGVNSKKLVDTLWQAGKQTVTGTCECVSFLGPALGGGHGWLQGHHGLISDQFLSMNVVLSNGTLTKIDATSDLFWGMKGAGHNFGIVTSVTTKVYDVVHKDWAIDTLIFSGDKIEAVYQTANEVIVQNGTQESDIINWSYWLNDASLDPEKPVILMYIIQEGVTTVDPRYTAPFHALYSLTSKTQTGTYLDLATWTGIALDSPPCQDFGFNNPRFPIYTKSYNITAQRKAYDLYAASISGPNNPYTNSIFMFEDYATAGVRALPTDTSAFGFREDLILAAPLIIYNSTGRAQDAEVEKLGNELREILKRGTGREELHTYVNYAFGTEGPEAWYGYEGWRQERLRGLKGEFDPKGRFGFYAPIV